MKRKIIKTADGSTTIHLEEWNEQYHSKHGAIQEAYHVFIKNGFELFSSKDSIVTPLNILEIGFGTGLNAFITFLEAKKQQIKVNYVGIEAYPVSDSEIASLNYIEQLAAETSAETFDRMHQVSWELPHNISNDFILVKRKQFFKDIDDTKLYHLIYFDAFGARVQPELWTEEIFAKMFKALLSKGVLVTYAAKGSVRRAMQAVGFKVERLPGPPGKREMLRAVRP